MTTGSDSPDGDVWLVASRLVGRLSLADGRALMTHVLGRARLLVDERIDRILISYQMPQRFETAPPDGALVRTLYQSLFLRRAGNEEAEHIRRAYRERLRVPEVRSLIDTVPLPALHSGTAPVSDIPLYLSNALAVLGLEDDEVLVCHPAGRAIHLSADLWQLAQLFAEPRAPNAEERTAAAFLKKHGVLWQDASEERRAALHLVESADAAELPAIRPIIERFRQIVEPYDLNILANPVPYLGKVAVVGLCLAQQHVEALEYLGRSVGHDVEVQGFMQPDAALAKEHWKCAVFHAAQYLPSLFESAASGLADELRLLADAAIKAIQQRHRDIRAHTASPILVFSASSPQLGPVPAGSRAYYQLQQVILAINQALVAMAEDDGATVVIDEESWVRRVNRGFYWDDEVNATPHHTALSSWNWAVLKPGATDVPPGYPGDRGRMMPAPPGQRDPSLVNATAILHTLLRLYEERPVRALVIEPNDLLWPGMVTRARARRIAWAGFMADVEDHFYVGINEAISALRRRGLPVFIVSLSTEELLRQEWPDWNGMLNFVRHEDCEFIVARGMEEDDSLLDHVRTRTGLSDEGLLWIDLMSDPPSRFRGRVFPAVHKWTLRRYLLTAPELTPLRLAVAAQKRPSEPKMGRTPSAFPGEHLRPAIWEAVAEELGKTHATMDCADDLRQCGLDSLGILSVVGRLEKKFGRRLPNWYLDENIFKVDRLIEAFQRTLRWGGVSSPSASRVGTAPSPDEDVTLSDSDRFIRRVFTQPRDRRALCFYGADDHCEWWTYGELLGRAAAQAARFRGAGLRPKDVCLIVLPSGPRAVVALLGAMLGGAIPILLAPPAMQGAHSQLQAMFESLRAELDPALVISDADAPLKLDDGELSLGMQDLSAHAPITLETRAAAGLVAMQLTSGTTGTPKICVWREQSLLAAIDNMYAAMNLNDDDVIVNWTPVYHDMGLVNNLFLALARGVPLVLLSPLDFVRDPALWLRALSRTGATHTWSPNFGFALVNQRVSDEELSGLNLGKMRGVWNAAERIDHIVYQSFGRRLAASGLTTSVLRTNYGLAEHTGGATFSTCTQPGYRFETVDGVALRQGSAMPVTEEHEGSSETVVGVGVPAPGTTVAILGDDGRFLGDGQIGQIVIQSPSLTDGYLVSGRLERNETDGWWHTGDLGYLRDGELFWVGRLRDVINIRGCKLDPSTFEPVINCVPGVRKGCYAAFGVVEESAGTERLVVLCEFKGEAPAERAAAESMIISGMIEAFGVRPDEVRLVEPGSLTKTSSGKRRHQYFRHAYISGTLFDPERAAVRSK